VVFWFKVWKVATCLTSKVVVERAIKQARGAGARIWTIALHVKRHEMMTVLI
jgi:hypothetical protein